MVLAIECGWLALFVVVVIVVVCIWMGGSTIELARTIGQQYIRWELRGRTLSEIIHQPVNDFRNFHINV